MSVSSRGVFSHRVHTCQGFTTGAKVGDRKPDGELTQDATGNLWRRDNVVSSQLASECRTASTGANSDNSLTQKSPHV